MQTEKGIHTVSSSSDDDVELVSKPLGKRLATKKNVVSPRRLKTSRPLGRRISAHTFSDSEESDESGARNITCIKVMPTSDSLFLSSSSSMLSSEFQASSATNRKNGVTSSISESSLISFSSCPSGSGIFTSETDKAKKPTARKKNPVTDEAKCLERAKKQQEKLLAKALKDVDREVQRSAKPEQCIKSMRVAFDNKLTEVSGINDVFNSLLDGDISYTVEKNAFDHSIVWYRRVADITVKDNQVVKQERDQLEEVLMLYISCSEFTEMVSATVLKQKGKRCDQKTLVELLSDVQVIFPNAKLTCVTVGLDSYIREQNSKKQGDKAGTSTVLKKVTKKDVDDVVVDLHLQCLGNYNPLKNMAEFGALLARFTKAIAEAPFKLEKQEQQRAFTWYAQADTSRPVKVEKDGKGFINLWQQQICQFTNIRKEVAQAIAAKYPSPLLLIKDYKKCTSEKEAIKLLQDIVVRRDYGPLGTTRKVGPELAYKLYRLFTSKDACEILQR